MTIFVIGILTGILVTRWRMGRKANGAARYERSVLDTLKKNGEDRDKALKAALEKIEARSANYELDARLLQDLENRNDRTKAALVKTLKIIGVTDRAIGTVLDELDSGNDMKQRKLSPTEWIDRYPYLRRCIEEADGER